MSGTARTTGRIRALTLAAVVLAVSTGAQANRPQASAASLVPGADFTISSTISGSPTAADQPALLYPGVTRFLWYEVSNPLPEPITVTALGIADVDAPAACPLANLDLGDPSFTGAFVVPARGAATVPAPKPIELIDLPDVNQDACKDVTFTFTFTGTGWYSDAPDQPAKVDTSTELATAPNLAAVGTPVTLTARVIPAGSTSGATSPTTTSLRSTPPAGTVTFYLTTAAGGRILLGTGTLGPDGAASLRLTSLPPGSGRVHAVYAGTDTFAGSTSAPAPLTVIAPPAQCTGTYTTSIIGTPESPVITGTAGNDFIYAVGADYRITGGKGNDCLVVGDGNNVISDGSGADVTIAGNGTNRITVVGSRNIALVGDGNGNRVTIKGTKKTTKKTRKGTKNAAKVRATQGNIVTLGNGAGNRVTVRNGSRNAITVGNGNANRVTIGKGSKNAIVVGNGAANRVKVGKGSKNRITVGDGARNRITVTGTKTSVTLGRGTKNRVALGTSTKPRATCSLPSPPETWGGTPARYYRDILTRCRVVTR